MYLCKQGDSVNELREVRTEGKRRGVKILCKHAVSAPTGPAVSQKKRAVRAEAALGMAIGASGLALRSGPVKEVLSGALNIESQHEFGSKW